MGAITIVADCGVNLNDKLRSKWLLWFIRVMLLSLLAICCLLLPSVVAMAFGIGGFASEKLIDRSGTNNSQLLIGRSGVADSNLAIGLALAVSALPPTGVSMDAGGTKATLVGSVTSMNGFPSATVWFEWGYNTNYGNIVGTRTVTTTGVVTQDISHFQPDNTVYYRFGSNADGTNYSSAQTLVANGTPAFNLMNYLLPIVFISLGIFLMIALMASGISPLLIILLGAVIIYMGTTFLQGIAVSLQSLW